MRCAYGDASVRASAATAASSSGSGDAPSASPSTRSTAATAIARSASPVLGATRATLNGGCRAGHYALRVSGSNGWTDTFARSRLAAQPPIRLAALALLAIVVVAVGVRVVAAFTWVNDEVSKTSGLTRVQREVAPARAVDIDPRPIELAARIIPEDATFSILVSDDYPFTYPVTALTLPSWSSYRLLPRRYMADPHAADWVISYGVPLGPRGIYPVETLDLGLGVSLAKTH